MGDEQRRADDEPEASRGARRARERAPAKRIFGTMAAAGVRSYSRPRDLPKLIALWPRELDDESAEGCRLVLGKLRRALRAERRRASSGHWSYDLNRHLALVTAHKAELARLEAEEARLRPTAPVAVES
ncbi:MAG: hypothetical protein WAU90_01230 [Methyloceanibacter sp.]